MSRVAIKVLVLLAVCQTIGFMAAADCRADAGYPTPSAYPISWELKFDHGTPHRITVDVADSNSPRAYWYMTYTVTNESDKEQHFYPQIDLLTADGNVHHSDGRTPNKVFEEIRLATHNKFLEPYTSISGSIRLGPAEARDGVAVWPETQPRMDRFSIFVTGLSGEAVIMQMGDGKLVKVDKPDDMYANTPEAEEKLLKEKLIILRKTLQLKYYIRGDEVYPGEDEVNKTGEEWIMR